MSGHTEGAHFASVIERLKYAGSKAGSIGLGEYTRVHKRDLATLIEAYETAKPVADDQPTIISMQMRLDRVKHFLTPEAATDAELRDVVNLALEVLAVGQSRGIKPEL